MTLYTVKMLYSSRDKEIVGARRIAPHTLFFILYSALYFVPLWIVSLSGYGEGILSQTGSDARTLMNEIAGVYVVGIASFVLGSWSVPKLARLLGSSEPRGSTLAKIPIYHVDVVLLSLLVAAFFFSKLLLVPTGVYTDYAFDSSMMETPVWNASMFFSETLAFASLIALFSKLRTNVTVFALLTMINGVNLLHGTRNFFVTAMTGLMLYAYIRKGLSLLRMAIYGAVGFSIAVLLAYIIYLYRQHAAFTDFSVVSILSPIIFESVFSQISLVRVLGQPTLIDAWGHPLSLISDIIIFTSPRFLVGHKETLLWASHLPELSPLGAANGFALGLLYLGYLFPLGYFTLGLMAAIIQRLAKQGYGTALYVYFCCDCLYRLQRDGYVIPAKMMINNIEILCILGCLHVWMRKRASMGESNSLPETGVSAQVIGGEKVLSA